MRSAPLVSLVPLVLAACGDAAGASAEPWERALERAGAERRPLLVHFAARDLAAGARLAREVFDDARARAGLERSALLVELDARGHADLFRRAFGEGGRLGCAWFAPDGSPLAALAGAPSAAEVELWCARVGERLERIEDARADDLERAELCLELFAWDAAEAAASRALATAEDPILRARAGALRARALVRAGRIAEARGELERLAGSAAATSGARLTRALTWLAEREPRRALAELDGPLPEREADEHLLARASALHDLARPEVLEPLRELLAGYPRSPWRADALVLLEHVLSPDPSHLH